MTHKRVVHGIAGSFGDAAFGLSQRLASLVGIFCKDAPAWESAEVVVAVPSKEFGALLAGELAPGSAGNEHARRAIAGLARRYGYDAGHPEDLVLEVGVVEMGGRDFILAQLRRVRSPTPW